MAKTTLHGPLWFCFTPVSGVITNRPYWLLVGAAHLVPRVAKMSDMSTCLLKSFEPPHPAPSLLSRSKPPPSLPWEVRLPIELPLVFFCRSRCGIILKDLFGLNLDWFSPRFSATWHFSLLKKTKQFWSPKWFPHQRIVRFSSIFPRNKQRTHPPCCCVFGTWRGFGR